MIIIELNRFLNCWLHYGIYLLTFLQTVYLFIVNDSMILIYFIITLIHIIMH